MSAATTPWPCPVCAEVVPVDAAECPACRASAEWIDLLRGLDFAIRRFELWKLEGYLTRDEYRAIVEDTRKRRDAWIQAVHLAKPAPTDVGLPPLKECWSCHFPNPPRVATHCPRCGAPLRTPEVRLLRYQALLCHEILRHRAAGRLSNAQWEHFFAQTPESQIELLQRLEKGRALVGP